MPDQQIQLQRWNETVSLVPPQHRGQSVAFEGLAKFAQHAEIRRFFGVPDAPLLDSDERLVIWIAERRNHHDAKWEWRAVQERELGVRCTKCMRCNLSGAFFLPGLLGVWII